MSKPSFSWDEAAAQISRNVRPNYLPAGSEGLTLTYAYRATDTAPTAPAGASQWIGSLNSDMGGFQPFNATQIQVMERVLDMIEDIANINFVRVGTGTTGSSALSDQAELLIGNYTTGEATSYGGWGAYRYFISNNSYTRAAKAWFDGSEDSIANPTSFNRGTTLFIHEILHTIGLSHPGDYNVTNDITPTYADSAVFREDSDQYTIMSYFDETETGANFGVNGPQTPLLYDIAALQKIYGANMTTRTEDNIYGYNSNTGIDAYTFPGPTARRIFTIWDAGGNDTINMSGLAVDCTINLNEEAFSSAGIRADGGPMINNISIARGVVIENAFGGGGNDTLIGNGVANTLRGGGGNDTLDGGLGLDSAFFPWCQGRLHDHSECQRILHCQRQNCWPGWHRYTECYRAASVLRSGLRPVDRPALPCPFRRQSVPGQSHCRRLPDPPRRHPGIAGFEFLIKGNLSTNFGAGAGPVFNDENIFINVANSLVQGNPIASAQFNSLASGATLAQQVASLYAKIIPLAKQTPDGLAYLTRPDGLKFYQDVAKERGITAENGPAVVAMASLLKVAVDGKNGIGNPISDLIASIADGSSELPATSQSVLPIETIDGTKFDADDAPDVMPGFSVQAPVPFIGVIEMQFDPAGL